MDYFFMPRGSNNSYIYIYIYAKEIIWTLLHHSVSAPDYMKSVLTSYEFRIFFSSRKYAKKGKCSPPSNVPSCPFLYQPVYLDINSSFWMSLNSKRATNTVSKVYFILNHIIFGIFELLLFLFPLLSFSLDHRIMIYIRGQGKYHPSTFIYSQLYTIKVTLHTKIHGTVPL